jgi:hypothetical protein
MTGPHGAETAHLPDDRIRLPALRPRRDRLGDIWIVPVPASPLHERSSRVPPSTVPASKVGTSSLDPCSGEAAAISADSFLEQVAAKSSE